MLARPNLVVAIAVLLAPVSTAMAEPVNPSDPSDPSDVVQIDLSNDMYVAPGTNDVADRPRPKRQGPVVVYLNYDGGTINGSSGYESNSKTNTSWVCSGTFTPFGDGQMKDASIQATRKDWDAYNVSIVTERPTSGDYVMNMIGGGSGCGSNNTGVAPVDCEDQNPNDIVFTFGTASSAFAADGIATINSQEIAHSFGLMHVNHQPDIMNPSANGSDQSFLDSCFNITGSANCGPQHERHCGSPTSQNSHQELLDILGNPIPDTAAPTVVITSPSNDEVMAAPATFTVAADAADDVAIAEVKIFIDGADQNSPDASAPYSWDLAGVPEGVYTFEVVAVDTAGNETMSAPVTIEVNADGETGESSASAGSESGESESGSGEPGETGGEGPGQDGGEDSGCGCRATPGAAPGATLLAMIGLLGFRRRR